MLNNKLHDEILEYLYVNQSANGPVLLNPLLKAGNYSNGEIASTIQYMVENGLVAGSSHRELNRQNELTRKFFTLDEIAIKTKIFPSGAKLYKDSIEKVIPIHFQVNASVGQLNSNNIHASGKSDVNIHQIQPTPDKKSNLEIASWIAGILALALALAAYYADNF